MGDQGVDRLALIRGEGGDVDEARHVPVRAGFGDHRAAVRVAHQDHRTALGVDHLAGRRRIAGERQGGVLHDGDVEAVLLEDVVDPAPPGAVHEPAVDQDDVLDGGRGVGGGPGQEGGGGGHGGDDLLGHVGSPCVCLR